MTGSPSDKRKKSQVIACGIAVRLFGGGLIFVGDGHTSLWSKALVILGVILSVSGIGILRFLLLSPLFDKMGAKIRASSEKRHDIE